MLGEKAYHQNCFRCGHCNRPLTLGSYAAVDSKVYCKPHYTQLFKEKGKYSDLSGPKDSNAAEQRKALAEKAKDSPSFAPKFATVATSSVRNKSILELAVKAEAEEEAKGKETKEEEPKAKDLPTEDETPAKVSNCNEIVLEILSQPISRLFQEPANGLRQNLQYDLHLYVIKI
jgi:hypothetical protein